MYRFFDPISRSFYPGGSHSIEEIIAGLQDAPVESVDPGQGQPLPMLRMRDVYSAGHGIYPFMAERLIQHDPDVLGILIDDYDHAAIGYEMETLFPAIRCPVLLLQADPSSGGVMTDSEVKRALPLLTQPTPVRLAGLSHNLHIEDSQKVLRAMEDFLYQHS